MIRFDDFYQTYFIDVNYLALNLSEYFIDYYTESDMQIFPQFFNSSMTISSLCFNETLHYNEFNFKLIVNGSFLDKFTLYFSRAIITARKNISEPDSLLYYRDITNLINIDNFNFQIKLNNLPDIFDIHVFFIVSDKSDDLKVIFIQHRMETKF